MQTASKHLKKDPGLSSEFVNPRVKKENNSFPSKKSTYVDIAAGLRTNRQAKRDVSLPITIFFR